MAVSKVRADYEQLAQIAKVFGAQADSIRNMLQTISQQEQVLEGGRWVGRGADKFYSEMNGSVLPSVRRLGDALVHAQKVTQQISRAMKEAETNAAALFKTDVAGDPGAAGSAPQDAVVPGGEEQESILPKWVTDVLAGVFLGDFSENSSLLKLIAQIVVGFTPAAPLADARDIVANIKAVIQGEELAWVGLALAVLAIIPSLDALKAAKVLKPVFKALGDEGSREVLEFIVKNPKEIGRVAGVLCTMVKNPEVVEVLAENPEAALRLIREGTPEVVEAYAKYGDEAFNLLKGIPIPAQVFEGFGLRPPQRRLDDVPGSKLTPEVEKFVTPGVHGDFKQYPLGTPGEFETKLLWTIDGQGAHFMPEDVPWDSSRRNPSHTNISDSAYFGGEAWRTGPNEITLNTASGAFGYSRRYAETLTGEAREAYQAAMQTRYDRAAEYFRQLGFEVKQIPITWT